MMVLAAVLLVIGLIALAGMVSRVNQLGSQTGVESDKAILDEVVPLQDAIDKAISTLQRRTFTGTIAATTPTTVTSTTSIFADSDVGLNVTITTAGSTTALPAGTKIASVTSPTVATLTAAASPLPQTGKAFAIFKPGFGLTATTYVRVEDAIVNSMEHLQRIQASHGFWMDYEIRCSTAGNLATGQVVAHLSDGTVWVEVRSEVAFPRSTSCASVTG